MKIKDLYVVALLRGVKFLHPDTGEVCIWQSHWSYPDGGAGVWYKKDVNSTHLFALTLDKIEDSLELEVWVEPECSCWGRQDTNTHHGKCPVVNKSPSLLKRVKEMAWKI